MCYSLLSLLLIVYVRWIQKLMKMPFPPQDYVVPDTEKLELQRLRTDIVKYYRSRLFLEQHKEDWVLLLDPENIHGIHQKGQSLGH